MERVLDVTERALGNGNVIRILESIRVRMFEDRPEGNCCPGAQLLWLVSTAYDHHQGIGQLIIDYAKIAR
jgi:hypothetical protein